MVIGKFSTHQDVHILTRSYGKFSVIGPCETVDRTWMKQQLNVGEHFGQLYAMRLENKADQS